MEYMLSMSILWLLARSLLVLNHLCLRGSLRLKVLTLCNSRPCSRTFFYTTIGQLLFEIPGDHSLFQVNRDGSSHDQCGAIRRYQFRKITHKKKNQRVHGIMQTPVKSGVNPK